MNRSLIVQRRRFGDDRRGVREARANIKQRTTTRMKTTTATPPGHLGHPSTRGTHGRTRAHPGSIAKFRFFPFDPNKRRNFHAPLRVTDGARWIDGDEGSQIGARYAASMWIFTKAVIYGQKHMEAFWHCEMNSIMEAINWVCACSQDDHDWISEFSLAGHQKIFRPSSVEGTRRDRASCGHTA